MANIFNHVECPRCFAQWDREEIEDQQCGACGWPEADSDNHEPDEPDPDGPRGRKAYHEESERMASWQRDLK